MRDPFFVTSLAGQISSPKIPEEFFTNHLEGKNELLKLKFTSDASDKTWEVKLNGRRFTGGWEDFSAAHGLRDDDVLIFKHDGDMAFHVSLSGRSFSQIQCVSSNAGDSEDNNESDEDDDGDDSESEDSCLIPVTISNLRLNRVCIAKHFAVTNGLDKRVCEIELINQSRKSWFLGLRYNRVTGQGHIRGGWRKFCRANKLKIGFSYRFKLVKNGTRPVLQLCSSGITPEGNCSKPHGKSNVSAKSSSSDSEDNDDDAEDSEEDDGGSEDDGDDYISEDDGSDEKFCLLAPTPSNLRQNRVKLSKPFTRATGLNKKRCCEIDLMNPSGKSWTHSLKYYATIVRACIGVGWRSFCRANKLKTGSFYRFKYVENGARPSLQLCSDVIQEGNCSKSSMKQNKFLTVIYTPYMLESRQLRLPLHFVKVIGIKEAGDITLVDKNGVKWPSSVTFTSRHGVQFYITTNWIRFYRANGLKTGETIMLEFVRGEGTIPMLKFCSMAKRGQALSDGSYEEEEAQETETPVQKRARVSAEGGPSCRTRASNNASADPRPCSISDQFTKVKQNIVDTLNDVKRLQSELEIKKQNLKASLQDIDALGERVFEINKLFK